MSYANLIADVQGKIQDDGSRLTTTNDTGDIARSILTALDTFERVRPRVLVADIAGANLNLLALPAGWQRGFSQIVQAIEYPQGNWPPALLPKKCWDIYSDIQTATAQADPRNPSNPTTLTITIGGTYAGTGTTYRVLIVKGGASTDAQCAISSIHNTDDVVTLQTITNGTPIALGANGGTITFAWSDQGLLSAGSLWEVTLGTNAAIPTSGLPIDRLMMYAAPSSTEVLRINFTARHACSSTSYTLDSTLDEKPVANLAASLCCLQLAAFYAQTKEDFTGADLADFGNKANYYLTLAEQYRNAYLDSFGQEDKTKAAAAVQMVFSPTLDTRGVEGREPLTHKQQWRQRGGYA